MSMTPTVYFFYGAKVLNPDKDNFWDIVEKYEDGHDWFFLSILETSPQGEDIWYLTKDHWCQIAYDHYGEQNTINVRQSILTDGSWRQDIAPSEIKVWAEKHGLKIAEPSHWITTSVR